MKKILKIATIISILSGCSPHFIPENPNNEKTAYKINTIAFYNLENLFDTIDDPAKNDETSPIMELDEKIRGEVYWRKNANMAKVISEIGLKVAKDVPAIVGVAEIENKHVLIDLINDSSLKDKDYGIIHFESPDYRGIDVALLYRKKLYRPIRSSAHEVVIYDINNPDKRYYTRDVLLSSGILDGDTLYFLVNHWPSRFGGEKRSRSNRERAAAVNKRIIDSIQSIDPYAKVIIMGDFNDGPYNTSIKKILNAKATKEETSVDGIYNPMENMQKKEGLGTIAYQDSWDLFDQILVTKPLLNKKKNAYSFYKAGIYNPDYLTNQEGRFKGYPFRSFSNGQFTGGYSDHFPVYIYLIKPTKP